MTIEIRIEVDTELDTADLLRLTTILFDHAAAVRLHKVELKALDGIAQTLAARAA